MPKLDALAKVKQIGIIPAIQTSNYVEAIKAAQAILAGGIPVIEVSLAPIDSLAALEAVAKELNRSMLIGAGTVVDGEGVRRAVGAGARFIVTPGFSAEAVTQAKASKTAIFAGALSPTEVQLAAGSEADAVKLFPCFASGGPRYLRTLRGQYPKAQFIASGGVTLDNCDDYLRAGACAIGIGAQMVDSDSLAAGDYRVFTVRAKRLRQAVEHARSFMRGDE